MTKTPENLPTRRHEHERHISNLFGLIGTETGKNLLVHLMARRGFAALTDEAVRELAFLHLREAREHDLADALLSEREGE